MENNRRSTNPFLNTPKINVIPASPSASTSTSTRPGNQAQQRPANSRHVAFSGNSRGGRNQSQATQAQAAGSSRSSNVGPNSASIMPVMPTDSKVQIPQVARYSIWQVPPPRVIREAMKCLKCENVRKPPYYECELGHLTCHVCNVSTSSSPNKATCSGDDSASNEQLCGLGCPAPAGDGNRDIRQCDAKIYRGNLKLYEALYDACLMNCPANEFGCDEKVPGPELAAHIIQCFYNKSKSCPLTYCDKLNIPMAYFLKHLETHDVPKITLLPNKWGPEKAFKLHFDRLKQGATLPKDKKHYDWVGTLIEFEGGLFMFICRELADHFVFWIHRLRSEPKKCDSNSGTPIERKVNQEVTQGKLIASIIFLDPKKRYETTWSGDVAEPDATFARVVTSGEMFKLTKSKMMKCWQNVDGPYGVYHSWFMRFKLEHEV